ncbi:DUF3450 domain-containing protein [uncultured Vibrio sp.]|uniref:DUF3450 domain-containing protein n=1 Tax=uncultured Vibrio sp. TaxID=114054 RepID=UPI0009248DED|nr:DUF3450 domain-containing protein [uncultured Vibrio sp.]OIQ26440.1 MAG: hypothetical protein BM561_01385 [Vibrio sp. MedPE-SWchi]
MNLFRACSLAVLTTVSCSSLASTLSDATAIQKETHKNAASSQKVIDKSFDSSQQLRTEIEQLEQELKNLQVYRQHLESMVENQQLESLSLASQIDQIQDTRQGVVPLMYQMLEGLKQIVDNDSPIRQQARVERINGLSEMMSLSDVSDAEKYRRILEAYQIEIDYGTKLGVYSGEIALSNGQMIDAEMFYLGRISLIARNRSGSEYWAWDRISKQWNSLSTSHNKQLDSAFKMANNQTAPSLLTIPLSFEPASRDLTGQKEAL